MAIKKCHVCGKKIKANETDCPHCGAFVYNYKDVHAANEDCKHIEDSIKDRDCTHETYSVEKTFTSKSNNLSGKKPTSYSQKTSYKQITDQQRVLLVLSIMFTLFGFGGNFIFAIIALTMIKKLRRDLYERSGLMPITAILRVVNIFSLIIFGIMIIFFLIGAAITELPIELLPTEIIESFF